MPEALGLPDTNVEITWSAHREGNEGWVLESYSDGTHREFGPMRAAMVPAFIEGRRLLVRMRMAARGHKPADPPSDAPFEL